MPFIGSYSTIYMLQRAITNSSNSLSDITERVASGLRVNSASDDAANLYLSRALQARTSGLDVANSNIQTALTGMQIAQSSYDSLINNLEQIKSLANSSLSSSVTTSQRTSYQTQAEALMTSVGSSLDDINLEMGIESPDFEIQSASSSVGSQLINEVDQLTRSEALAQGYNLIETADDFENIGSSGKYILMNDIDFTEKGAYTGNIVSTASFSGELNGNGYTLKDITLSGTANNKGIMKSLSASATVKNLVIENVSVASGGTTGGVLAYENSGTIDNVSVINANASGISTYGSIIGLNNSNGKISNAYSSGSITSASDTTGGLVGANFGSITKSYSDTTISASTSNTLGGLVGINVGTILESYANGSITSSGNKVGGLTGENAGTIKNTYAKNTVSGAHTLGGLVGLNTGSIDSSYSDNLVTGTGDNVGGLIGIYSGGATTVTNVYSSSTVSGVNNSGGLIGEINGGNISNAYFNGTATLTGNNVGGLIGEMNGVGSIEDVYTTTNMTSSTGSYIGGLIGRDSSTISITNAYATGNVSGDDYVGGLIGYENGLKTIDNVYATGTVAAADDYAGGIAGFFDEATLKNSHYEGTSVTGDGRVGGLVGRLDPGTSNTKIIESYTDSMVTVSGRDEVGGIVGSQDSAGILYRVYSEATVIGRSDTGGISGYCNGDMHDVYFSGTVDDDGSGDASVGGLVGGLNGGGDIFSGYSDATLIGTDAVVAGRNNGTTHDKVYWNSDKGTRYNSMSGTFNGIAQTTLQLQTGDDIQFGDNNFDWEFTIDGPKLKWQKNISSIQGNVEGDLINSVRQLSEAEATAMGYTVIHDATELQNIATSAMDGKYILANDIDMSTVSSWTPIGTSGDKFSGIFNGNGYSISNFNITTNNYGDPFGLFGYVDGYDSAQIKNLVIKDSTLNFTNTGTNYNGFLIGDIEEGLVENIAVVNSTMSAKSALEIGLLIGKAHDGRGQIKNVYSTGTITATDNSTGHTNENIGGLIGIMQEDFSLFNAYSTATVNVINDGGATYYTNVGGLVGHSTGWIDQAYYSGTVNTNDVRNVGGLVGYYAGDGDVQNSYSEGTLITTGSRSDYIGGLVGLTSSTYNTIDNSYSTIDVAGDSFLGGLVGYARGNITNSYATGDVYDNTQGSIIGGLVGEADTIIIDNSYATGNVSNGGRSGGLVGYSYHGDISNSYATGNITNSNSHSGGLIGYQDGNSITNSYATGNTDTSGYAGGLVGYLSGSGAVSYSYATGNANSSINSAGGFIGRTDSGTNISNSYSTGNVSGTSTANLGGFIGQNSAGVTYSYSTGLVSDSTNAGGFMGTSTTTSTTNYWNTETSGQSTSAGSAVGLTNEEFLSGESPISNLGTLTWDTLGAIPTLAWQNTTAGSNLGTYEIGTSTEVTISEMSASGNGASLYIHSNESSRDSAGIDITDLGINLPEVFVNLNSADEAAESLNSINEALEHVRSKQANLNTNIDLLEKKIELNTTNKNTMDKNISTIRDIDTAEETARFLEEKLKSDTTLNMMSQYMNWQSSMIDTLLSKNANLMNSFYTTMNSNSSSNYSQYLNY